MTGDNLPEGWAKATLREILNISSGKNLTQSKMIEGPVPVFGGNGITGWHIEPNVTEETLVIGRVGYYCGSVHITPKLAWITDNAFITQFSKSYISKTFLFRLLQNTDLRQNDSSSAQPVISGAKIYPIEIKLPPLTEQKVIADKLDKLLAQVETTKARLERIPEILKTFRQSVLAAAVSGKLTEEWREENDASIEHWNSANIGSIAQVATGKTPKRTNAEYWNGGDIPWLTSAVTGAAYTYEAEQFVTKLAVKECTLKLFPIGTLLLAMYGEGKTRGQVTELQIEATCNQACAAIIVDETKVSKDFLKLRLQENYEETRKAAVGGAQPNLNLNKVREIRVDLPSEYEQTEIVRCVQEVFAFADSIEQKANAAIERVNNLTQSILAKAFRGELTAEWRVANPELISGENSAEALLEKIKAERAAI